MPNDPKQAPERITTPIKARKPGEAGKHFRKIATSVERVDIGDPDSEPGEPSSAEPTPPFSNRLTNAQSERLYLLLEEMGEALQICGKILRHGYESFDPTGQVEGDNRHLLTKELGDVQCAIDFLCSSGDLNWKAIQRRSSEKCEKVKQYMHHQSYSAVPAPSKGATKGGDANVPDQTTGRVNAVTGGSPSDNETAQSEGTTPPLICDCGHRDHHHGLASWNDAGCENSGCNCPRSYESFGHECAHKCCAHERVHELCHCHKCGTFYPNPDFKATPPCLAAATLDERAEFERQAVLMGFDVDGWDGEGYPADIETDAMWRGWQARAALAGKEQK